MNDTERLRQLSDVEQRLTELLVIVQAMQRVQ